MNRIAMLTSALCAALALPAGATEAISEDPLEAIASSGPSTAVTVDRSWLYNDPARIAAPGRTVGVLRLSYGGSSPTRAFAANVGARGTLLEMGGEVGLADRLSAVAIGAQGQDPAGSPQTGAVLGLRWSALPRSVRNTQLVVSGGVLRELQGNNGTWARVSLGQDVGLARLALAVHGEKMFAAGRDGLDVMVTAGATTRLSETVRAGVEYVGQDLEGTFGGESEGGARHIVGPVVSAALWNQKVSLVGGPAVALGANQPRVLARVGAACQF